MMVACAANNVPVVEFLAKRFPQTADWKNKEGLTGLMIAAKAGNDGVIKTLLDTVRDWVDIDAQDANGNTALHVGINPAVLRFRFTVGITLHSLTSVIPGGGGSSTHQRTAIVRYQYNVIAVHS